MKLQLLSENNDNRPQEWLEATEKLKFMIANPVRVDLDWDDLPVLKDSLAKPAAGSDDPFNEVSDKYGGDDGPDVSMSLVCYKRNWPKCEDEWPGYYQEDASTVRIGDISLWTQPPENHHYGQIPHTHVYMNLSQITYIPVSVLRSIVEKITYKILGMLDEA